MTSSEPKYRFGLTYAQSESMIRRNKKIRTRLERNGWIGYDPEAITRLLKRYYKHIVDVRKKDHHPREAQQWIFDNVTAPYDCIYQIWAFDSADDAFHFKLRFG